MEGKQRIVFAGLGAMGRGMASHLLRSGFPINAYDVYQPSLDNIVAQGAQSANTPAEASTGQSCLICMVANSKQVTPLLFDAEQGAAARLAKDASVIMCSTVAPAYIEELQSRLKRVGRPDIHLIDSPVSGGAARAAEGTLSIFSSGAIEHLETVREILECLSSKLYQIPGGLGGGSKAKLIHQIFAGVNIATASEAMGLVAKAGLDTRAAFDTLKDSEGGSWMFSNRVPHMLDPTLPPYSAISIIAKDVGIITESSRRSKFPLPMISTADQLYSMAISNGWAQEDDCVLARLYLPGEYDLINKQQGPQKTSQPVGQITVIDIKDLMIAVHLAGMAEAMAYCESLGIDTDLMYDIVANAAGASAAFLTYFKALQKGRWSLNAVSDHATIADRLVSDPSPLIQLIANNHAGVGDR